MIGIDLFLCQKQQWTSWAHTAAELPPKVTPDNIFINDGQGSHKEHPQAVRFRLREVPAI